MRRRTFLAGLGAIACGAEAERRDSSKRDACCGTAEMIGIANAISLGMSGSTGAAYSPLNQEGLIAWWSPESDTSMPDATIVTRNDKSATGAHASEVAAGTGPTYKTTRWDGQACLHFNLDGIYTSAAAVVAAINGTDTEFTLVSVHQVLTNAIQIPASFVNDAASQSFQMRQNSFQYKHEVLSTGQTAKQSGKGTSFSPQVRVYRKLASNLIQHGVDGVSETPQANTMGAITMTRLGHGCLPDTTPFYGGNYIEQHMFLFSGNRTDAELAPLYAWLRANVNGLGWKAGLGATAGHASGTLIPVIIGQSNGAGRALSSYTHTAARVKHLYQDMFVREFADPATNPTNAVGWTYVDNGTRNSMQGRMADRFRELGWNQDLLFVNACKSSTGTDSWRTGATINPATTASLVGKLKQMLWEALKAPNAKIGPIVIYQGETNGAGELCDSTDWGPDWTLICDEIKTVFAGHFYDPDHAFIVVKIATNTPTGSFPEWEPVRTAQQVWADARSDAEIIESGAATVDDNVHQDMGADDTEGLRLVAVRVVDAWDAAVTP